MPSVLVVDDDRAVQEMLVDLLKGAGYVVRSCRDGKRVVPDLEEHPCDLVLLDVLIPHVNGFGVIEQIRASAELRDLPVIMMSGIYRSRNHRAEMSTRFNVIEYLDKPLPIERLLELVRKTIGPGREGEVTELPRSSGSAELDELLGSALDDLDGAKEKPVEPVALGRPRRPIVAPTEPPPAAEEKMVDSSTQDERRRVESEAKASFRTSAFVLQGSISKNPTASVLGKLWQQRASGGLLLRRNRVKKIVFFRQGDPYLVQSNLVSECLGQILLRERLINEEECERSLALMRETGARQGELLIEMRSLTPRNLDFALELQQETKLYETFTWESGEYRFSNLVDLPKEGTKLGWTGKAVVAEGLRRAFDETRLRRIMLPVLDVPLAFQDGKPDLDGMGFSPRELSALAGLRPPVNMRTLFDKLPLEPPDTLRVIYTLIALEILIPAT